MSGFHSVMVHTFGPTTEKTPVSEPSVSLQKSESVCISRTQKTASGVSNVLVYILLQVNPHYLFLGIVIITPTPDLNTQGIFCGASWSSNILLVVSYSWEQTFHRKFVLEPQEN